MLAGRILNRPDVVQELVGDVETQIEGGKGIDWRGRLKMPPAPPEDPRRKEARRRLMEKLKELEKEKAASAEQ